MRQETFIDKLKKLDWKIVIIVILASLFVVNLCNKPDPIVDRHEAEIKTLQSKNKEAYKVIDSLNSSIAEHEKAYEKLAKQYLVLDKEATKKQKIIERLTKKANEIPNRVNSLDANGVASELEKYLERQNTGNDK